MLMSKEVLVLGAGFAGISAAIDLKSRGVDIAVIDAKGYHEYVPGIVDVYRHRVPEKQNKVDLESFFEETGIDFIQQEVTEIRPEEQVVETSQGRYDYDNLVVALGGEPATYGLDVSEAETVYSLEGVESAMDKLENAESVLIVGSGYVGMETAGELMEQGLKVKVVDKSTRPMPAAPERASQIALDYMNRHEINFMGGRQVVEVGKDRVVTESGDEIQADVVLWSGGVQVSDVVQQSLNCGPEGLPVNSGLCSKQYENVFAAGDCADTDIRKLAQNAIKQGRLVARNVAKGQNEELEHYEGSDILVVSLGNTGFMLWKGRVYKNKAFRYLKDLIRTDYLMRLRLRRWKLRFLRKWGG